MHEMNFFRREMQREMQAVRGLGKRDLPQNPGSSAIPLTVDRLSKNAKGFWERRKYGAFAVSIFTDPTIKMVISELSHEETRLFASYLIGILAADDRQAVKALPKSHPDRKAYAEIFWFEKRKTSAIVEEVVCALSDKAGSANAEEAVGLISQELAGAADDVKRIFFRKLTKEVSAASRDDLITSRLRSRVAQIARIKDQALTKSS